MRLNCFCSKANLVDPSVTAALSSPIHQGCVQAAKILMLQREEKDAPSDFQDYTLLALVAVSAFLSNINLGERNGLIVLAQRYDQDVEPLQQVVKTFACAALYRVHIARRALSWGKTSTALVLQARRHLALIHLQTWKNCRFQFFTEYKAHGLSLLSVT